MYIKHVFLLALTQAVWLGGCATVRPAALATDFEQRARNLTAELALSPSDAGAVSARCEQGTQLVASMLAEFEGRTGPASASELRDYDAMRRLHWGIGLGESTILSEAHADPDVRQAASDCRQRFAELDSALALSQPVYDRLSSIPLDALPARDQYFQDKVLSEFRRRGVDRDGTTREQLEALDKQLSELSLAFGKNLREGQRELRLPPGTDLGGLPADFIAGRTGEDGVITITSAYPDIIPVLTYAENETLRRKTLEMFYRRAWPENVAVLRSLLEARARYANLLGYGSWADLALADKMAAEPARAEQLIDGLEAAASDAGRAEYQRMLAELQQRDPAATRVPEWSRSFLTDQVRQKDFDIDAKAIREYFAYPRVSEGIQALVEDLFGVEIRPWADAPRWHEDVTAHEMLQDGRLIGRFYLDMHPREGKYSHAMAVPIRLGPRPDGPPVAALICNFERGLMEHGQVETFLHEFGHLIHVLFAAQDDYNEMSMHTLEWDFLEAPSQMLEQWIWDYATVSRFARNADGEVLPAELFERMLAARDFGLGQTTLRDLSYANVSLHYYWKDPGEVDFKALWDASEQRFNPVETLADAHPYAGFGHLDGYSAYYYTYQWSLAISTELFSQFQQAGLRDTTTAQRYRSEILSQGASRPAAELVREFLGRDWSVEAYEARLRNAASSAKPGK